MPNYDKEIELLAMNPHEFSPVVISGNSGNGKTDFLQKFCEKWKRLHKSASEEQSDSKCVKILKSNDIYQNIIDSISKNEPLKWQEAFVPYSVIIIDDIDTLAAKMTTQDILLYYLTSCNKSIVVTSETDIKGRGFSSKFSAFFSSGAHIHIDSPDKDSKQDFLTDQLTVNNLFVDEDALLWLTDQNFASFAAIKGFIKTLRFFKTDRAYTLEECKRLVKSYITI